MNISKYFFILGLGLSAIVSFETQAYNYTSKGVGADRSKACNQADDKIQRGSTTSGCICSNIQQTYWVCKINYDKPKPVVYTAPPIYQAPAPTRRSYNFSAPGVL